MVPDITVPESLAASKIESRISGAQMFRNIMARDGETHDDTNCTEKITKHTEKFTVSSSPDAQETISSISSHPTSPKGATSHMHTSDIFAASPSSIVKKR